jgi:hypothetical protein
MTKEDAIAQFIKICKQENVIINSLISKMTTENNELVIKNFKLENGLCKAFQKWFTVNNYMPERLVLDTNELTD